MLCVTPPTQNVSQIDRLIGLEYMFLKYSIKTTSSFCLINSNFHTSFHLFYILVFCIFFSCYVYTAHYIYNKPLKKQFTFVEFSVLNNKNKYKFDNKHNKLARTCSREIHLVIKRTIKKLN